MKKIALLILVIFAIFACSNDDDKTYSIKIRNNCNHEIYDVEISMYSLDQTSPKYEEVLYLGSETGKYDFHFDKTSSNGCGKLTEIDISPIFVISYTNGIQQYNLQIQMEDYQSSNIKLVLEENIYYAIEL